MTSQSVSCILKLPACVLLHFSPKYCFDLGEKTSGGALAHTAAQSPAPQLLRGIPEGPGMLGCLNACIMTGKKKKKIGDPVPHPPRIPLTRPSELDASLFFFFLGETQFFFFFKTFLFSFLLPTASYKGLPLSVPLHGEKPSHTNGSCQIRVGASEKKAGCGVWAGW